jgi:hypothetical protein
MATNKEKDRRGLRLIHSPDHHQTNVTSLPAPTIYDNLLAIAHIVTVGKHLSPLQCWIARRMLEAVSDAEVGQLIREFAKHLTDEYANNQGATVLQ